MSTNVKLRRSAVQGRVPTTSQLELGELAINTYDGRLYFKKNDGSEGIVTVREITEDTLLIDSSGFGNTSATTLAGVLADLDSSIQDGLVTVATDGTISGDGTAGSPLSIGQDVSSGADVTFNDISVQELSFDTNHVHTGPTPPGHLDWNAADGTLNLRLAGGNAVLQVGQENVFYVRNNTGSTIPNGTVVGIVGAQGGKILVAPFIADGSFLPGQIGGVTTEDIASGELGYVTTFGFVRGIDTTGFVAGTFLYASADTAGAFTSTVPESPNVKVIVGIVTEVGTEGAVAVRPNFSPLSSEVTYDNTESELVATNVKGAIDELNLKKLDVSALSANINFYPTTADSDITGYSKLVTDTQDPDFDSTAVDVPTGAIDSEEVEVSTFATEPGAIVGSTATINITIIGNVRRTSGAFSGTAAFYFKVYKRDAAGNETLLTTSNLSSNVTEDLYEEFFADALLPDTVMTATDRLVFTFLGSRTSDFGSPTFDIQIGGTNPVRILVPVPLSAVPADDASGIVTDSSSFNGKLSASDTTVQAALETLDDHSHTTSEITEGSRLYYTEARANSAIDARVTRPFVDALSVDAGKLEGQTGAYYLDYPNFTNTPTIGNATVTINAGTALENGGAFNVNQTSDLTIDINHEGITRSNTVSSVTADYGDDITIIDSITSNSEGHITAVNTKTVTLPSSDNTDNYVDSVSFGISDGVLTLGRTGGLPDLTVDLDGRYLTEAGAVEAGDVSYDNTSSGLVSTSVQGAVDELNTNKADVGILSSNVNFYFTTTASTDVAGYSQIVDSITDPAFSSTAVNYTTVALTDDTLTLVEEYVSEEGVFNGDLAGTIVTIVSSIKRASGSENGEFLYEVYHRGSNGIEELLGTSGYTDTVDSTTYKQFNQSTFLSSQEFSETCRVVIKVYGRLEPGTTGNSTFHIQYGGTNPARGLFPAPVSVVPSNNKAERVTVATSNFNGLLSGSDSDVQSALETLDDVDLSVYLTSETVTSLTHDSVNTNLVYTDENGTQNTIDLSQYIDDTNLARITSGTVDASGIATFTRDDATTFTVDFSVLFDDTNLTRITSAAFNTANGVLTLTRSDSTNVSVDLDGRYDNYSHWIASDGTNQAQVNTGESVTFQGSGATTVSFNPSTQTYTVNSTDTNTDTNDIDYINNGSFNTSTGDLTLTGVGNAGATINLDGRYDNYSSWELRTDGVSRGPISSEESVNFVGGSNVSLSYSSTNNTITINSTDTNTDTNNYLTGLSFNTSDGVLTATRLGLSDVTVDLDGRYLQSYTETDTLDSVTDRNNTTSNDINVGGVTVGSSSKFDGVKVTTATASETTIASFSAASFRGGKVMITASQGSNRMISELLVTHDGTNAFATEYGMVSTGSNFTSYDVDISGGQVRIKSTSTTAASTEYSVSLILSL